MTVCLTGHRPIKLPWGYDEQSLIAKEFKKQVRNKIIEFYDRGYNKFYCGMAEGFDLICARIIVDLNNSGRTEIDLICVIPYTGQESRWSAESKAEYWDIIKNCKDFYYSSSEYTKNCMQKRNIEMVNNCDVIFACFDKTSGGTANTIKYGVKKGLPIVKINPRTNEVTEIVEQCSFLDDEV